MAFYRPQSNEGQYNSWKKGVNEVAIVGVSQLEGEALAKTLARKSEKRGYQVTKLDINLVIEVAKKDYEYTKRMTYAFAFDRDVKGNVCGATKDGSSDLKNAWNMFDMLLSKPQLGIDESGKVITESGKEIASLASYLKTAVNKDDYKFLAWMEKGDKYWNCQMLCRGDVSTSMNLFEKQVDNYWAKRPQYVNQATQQKPDYTGEDCPFINNDDDGAIFQ